RSLASADVDPVAIGAEWTRRLADGLARATAVRDRGVPAGCRVVDVHFADLMRDEIAMVRRIYTELDLELTGDAERRMRAFLAENPRDKHGAHRYALAAAGLEAPTERRRYAAYQTRFGIVSENMG